MAQWPPCSAGHQLYGGLNAARDAPRRPKAKLCASKLKSPMSTYSQGPLRPESEEGRLGLEEMFSVDEAALENAFSVDTGSLEEAMARPV